MKGGYFFFCMSSFACPKEAQLRCLERWLNTHSLAIEYAGSHSSSQILGIVWLTIELYLLLNLSRSLIKVVPIEC